MCRTERRLILCGGALPYYSFITFNQICIDSLQSSSSKEISFFIAAFLTISPLIIERYCSSSVYPSSSSSGIGLSVSVLPILLSGAHQLVDICLSAGTSRRASAPDSPSSPGKRRWPPYPYKNPCPHTQNSSAAGHSAQNRTGLRIPWIHKI